MTSKVYFDEVAQQWDTLRERFYSDNVREQALAIAAVQPGRLAADIGAGTGFITEGLIGRGLQVIAVDQSATMLAEMQKKFAGVTQIDYRLGEAESLPIPAETVDYVFANMFLHHVERPAETIQALARLLKPGGKLVITDTDEHNHTFLREVHHDRWLGFPRADIHNWFRQAGLQHITVEDMGENCCTTDACGGEGINISIFVAVGEK
ncbi:MAG: class I SAM-dependent methyltransferase [Caldilineaceae bacterium]